VHTAVFRITLQEVQFFSYLSFIVIINYLKIFRYVYNI